MAFITSAHHDKYCELDKYCAHHDRYYDVRLRTCPNLSAQVKYPLV